MQPAKPRNNKDKPKHRKPSRISGDQPQHLYPNDSRRRGGPIQLTRRTDDPAHSYSAKPQLQSVGIPIYKQDLLQKGFEIFHSKRNQERAVEVSERHPECFNVHKRKVICEVCDQGPLEQTDFSTSKINLRDELKEDFGHLLDNEDIPDWFMEGTQGSSQKLSFDFGSTVDRTKQFYSRKTRGQDGPSTTTVQAVELNPEINFDDLDKLLEEKYKESRAVGLPELEGDEGLLDTITDEVGLHRPQELDDEGLAQTPGRLEEHGYSMNDSGEYFKDLHGNLKKAILKYGQFSSGDEKDSDESFQESLGFEAKRDGRTHKAEGPGTAPAPTTPTPDQLQHFQSLIHAVDPKSATPNMISFNMTLCDDLPASVVEANAFREAVEKDEVLKFTEAEKAHRQQQFLAKYGYLDPIMCQLCYEILVSKSRQSINELSANGFNQKSVERYCANKYKIFSLFLQGDIISKVWFYKEKHGPVAGPFMSYDMDIWNGEAGFFSEEVMVSLDQSPFLSILFWVHRSNLVLKIVDKFICLTEDRKKTAPPVGKRWRQSGEQRRYDKRVSFNKKADSEAEHAPVKPRNDDSLVQNYNELFPALEEAQAVEKSKTEKRHRKQSEAGEAHLLDTLRASLSNAKDKAEEKRETHPVTQAITQQKAPQSGHGVSNEGIEKEQSEKVERDRRREGNARGRGDASKRQGQASEKNEGKKQSKGQKAPTQSKGKNDPVVTEQPVFVKKEFGDPEPDPSSKEKQSLDKQKTENIKQMLGLNF